MQFNKRIGNAEPIASSGCLISKAQLRPISSVTAAVAIVGVAFIQSPYKSSAYSRLLGQRNTLYARLEPGGSNGISSLGLFNPAALKALTEKAKQSTGAKIGMRLREGGATAGSDVLVTVSPAFEAYWKLTAKCNAAPLLIPAYFGLPLLKGLPPASQACDLGPYYGYALYGPNSRATMLDDATFWCLTRDKGFESLIIIESENKVRRLECVPKQGVIAPSREKANE